jgi:hypothetical protein
LLHVFRLVCEDLLGEVVEDVSLGLPEDFDEVWRMSGGVRVGRAARERLTLRDLPDELQRGNPTMRALAVFGQLLGRQLKVEDLAEQFARLFVCEEQLGAVDDGERGLRAQTRQRQRRHVARDDDDVHHVRQVGEQAVDDAMDGRFSAEMMIVVEDEDELPLDVVEHLVQEHVDGALGLLREFFGRLLKIGERGLAEVLEDLLDAVRDVAEEDEGVCVRVVELIPDELLRVCADKVCDERGLARAGVGGDERDRVREVLQQTLDEARARQQRRRGARRQQLCAQEKGRRGGSSPARRRRGCVRSGALSRLLFLSMQTVRHQPHPSRARSPLLK